MRLAHGDRLVLGPARLVCLFVTEPLGLADKQRWTYEAAFHELTAGGAARELAWASLSPERRAAAAALASVEAEQVSALCI